jgi:hypothetical protein
MIAKAITGITFILLLFLNPLKWEDTKVCLNIPFVDAHCIGKTQIHERVQTLRDLQED